MKKDNIDINIKCTSLEHKCDTNPRGYIGNVTLPGLETLTAYVNSITITVKDHNNTVIKVKNIKSLDTIVLYSTNDPFSKPVIFKRKWH